jgi:hypothetical protein
MNRRALSERSELVRLHSLRPSQEPDGRRRITARGNRLSMYPQQHEDARFPLSMISKIVQEWVTGLWRGRAVQPTPEKRRAVF